MGPCTPYSRDILGIVGRVGVSGMEGLRREKEKKLSGCQF